MMKPKQIDFRTGCNIAKLRAKRFVILTYSIRASLSPVKSNPFRISLMIIRRCPVFPNAFGSPPGAWSVVVLRCKNVVKTKRHHVVNSGFVTFKHHLFYRRKKTYVPVNRSLSFAKSELKPFVSNFFAGQLIVPCQFAKSEPVGLSKIVSAPVGVQSNIGDAGNRGMFLRENAAIGYPGNGTSYSYLKCFALQAFFPHAR